MRARLGSLALAAAVALVAAGCADTYGNGRRSARVGVSAEYGSFHDYAALSPYGTWVAASYGWAWCPLDVGVGWRPYTVGRWAYTDWGWMWLSDDPWGALPYHYGRWAYDDFYGWVWIPGDVWAPAWVSWRYGADWIGWAPLPPDLGWDVGVGFRYSSSAIDDRIDPLSWCFVPSGGFLSAGVGRRAVPPSRNVTILKATKNVTRYEEVRSRPAERGLSPEWVSRETGRSVPRHRLVDVASVSYRAKPAVRGRDIAVNRGPVVENRNGVDLVRANPPERQRTTAPRRLIERQRREQSLASRAMRQERAELSRIQEQERRRWPTGVSAEALRRRHLEEQRAQDIREERVIRAYERRQQRLERQDRNDDRGRWREPPGDRGRSRGRGQEERNRS